MPLGNSGQRSAATRTTDFQRSQSLSARYTTTSNTTQSSSSRSYGNFGSLSQNKSYSTSSSSSTYKGFSTQKHEESVFTRNYANRSSINKPELSSISKEHLTDNMAFTNTEKGSFLERKQPFRTTLNTPLGSYTTSSALAARRNAPPLTGATFSGTSSLSMPRLEPPPIPIGYDAVGARSIPTSPPKTSNQSVPLVPLVGTAAQNKLNSKATVPITKPIAPANNKNVYDVKDRKGYAIIFNNEKFDGNTKDYRVGSRNDEKELQKTLGRFSIDVKVERDPSLGTIEKKVKEISKMDFRKKSCLFVCILSHGNQGQTIFAKDKPYNLDKDIIEPIIRNATLIGKPKIFIVQACKGSAPSIGYAMMDANPVQASSLTKPSEADILILYSSYEGRVSYRMAVGSIFIQKLCTFINTHYMTKSLEEIMKETRRDIIENSDPGLKQTPTMVSTLTKDFYFKTL
uniref:Putative caspase n=1 Tax=Lutzomyia longipalpis TaxID=7200 RepID=A0A7G3A8V9_LUTLO